MSKVDAMRAMREAKHARGGAPPDPPGAAGRARSTSPASQRRTTAGPAADPSAGTGDTPADTPADTADVPTTEELCGHRNIGGKSCSRPAGHSEKNHRYR